MVKVYGNIVDDHTRCTHYQSELDIIAIKCRCCRKYYPCYKCHLEDTGVEPEKWTAEDTNENAILCGDCKSELTICQYIQSNNACPEKNCLGSFNPGCSLHYHLYFEPGCVERCRGAELNVMLQAPISHHLSQ